MTIELLFCMDSIEPFTKKGSESVTPAEYCVLSLPPSVRYQSKNMLCWLLMPPSLKASQQAKFFSFFVDHELRSLHTDGILGVPVRVFGVSLDLVGRDKFFWKKSCTSYNGCSVCDIHFRPGLHRKPVYIGARKWLPVNSPLRNIFYQGFDFICEERAGPPTSRTTNSVAEACILVAEEELEHYMGMFLYLYQNFVNHLCLYHHHTKQVSAGHPCFTVCQTSAMNGTISQMSVTISAVCSLCSSESLLGSKVLACTRVGTVTKCTD